VECLALLNICLRGYNALASYAIQIPACPRVEGLGPRRPRHCEFQKADMLAARRNFRRWFAQSRLMNGTRHKYAGTQSRLFSLGYGKEGAEVFTTLSFAKDWHKTISNPQRAFSVRLPSTPTPEIATCVSNHLSSSLQLGEFIDIRQHSRYEPDEQICISISNIDHYMQYIQN